MSNYMRDCIITGIISISVVLGVSSIGFFTHIDHAKGDNYKIECVKAGGSYTVDEDSDQDSPNYECVNK